MSRVAYPVIYPPLPPGLVTLSDYGPSIGLTKAYIQVYWRPLDGFPEPVGQLPPGGRHGGGRGQLVYIRATLDAFRLEMENQRVRRSSRLIIGHDPRERVTLEEFTAICGACDVTPDPVRFRGCPAADADGLRTLGALIHWHNTLPPSAGPRLAVTPLGPRELVTVTGFARLAGVHPTTVSQYQGQPEFPDPAGDGRYLLGRIAAWWNSRPGKAPSESPDRTAAAAARAVRALEILGDDAPAHLVTAGRLRAANPTATLAELGRLADPPLSRDAIAARIRRLITLAHLPEANQRRQSPAAAAARAARALEILGADVPESLAMAGRLRTAHPQASQEELGQLADPPLTQSAIAGRLRRLMAMADRRASDLSLPGTGV